MNNPKFVKVKDRKFKINTDFRVAIQCDTIARDKSINTYEKSLAIIFLLFGEEGLNATEDYENLLELGLKYLCCGKEPNDNADIDMDLKQDERLIESSFKYDYGYDPYKMKYLHWWDFYNDLCNLSNSELGNCCILNRVRNIRTYDLSQIKDANTRAKIEEAKEQVALKKEEKQLTEAQERSINKFNKLAGLE